MTKEGLKIFCRDFEYSAKFTENEGRTEVKIRRGLCPLEIIFDCGEFLIGTGGGYCTVEDITDAADFVMYLNDRVDEMDFLHPNKPMAVRHEKK